MARKSSDDTSRRLKRERKQRLEGGGAPGGWRRYGETAEHTVDPVEAAFIRQAVALLLAGTSLRSTALQLHAAGARTPRGNAWRANKLKQMLLLDHPGIVSAADADQLARTIKRPENAVPPGLAPHSLLTGILVCGKPKPDGSLCGAKLRANGDKYRCPHPEMGGCNRIAIHLAKTDALITRRVLGAFGSSRPVAFSPPDSDVRRLAELRRRVTEVAADLALPDHLIAVRIAALEAEIEACEMRLQVAAERHAVAIQAEALRSRWDTLAIDEKRVALRTVIVQIVVAPCGPNRKRFDSDRLDVQWVEVEEFERPGEFHHGEKPQQL